MWRPIETAPRDGTEILAILSVGNERAGGPAFYGPWTVAFRRNKWMASWDNASVVESDGEWGTSYLHAPLGLTHWWDFGDMLAMPPPPEEQTAHGS